MFRILAIAVVLLAGCVSAEQAALNRQAEAERFRQQQAAYQRQLQNQCESIGYQPNTEPWRQCILTLHLQKQQEMANLRNTIIQHELQQESLSMPKCLDGPLGEYLRRQGRCR